MKKILFFLILSTIIISCLKVNATTYKFYEAETLPTIYINRYDASTQIMYYQKARIFRSLSTNEIAYCIEAFNSFRDTGEYTQNNPANLSASQLDRITKIAHYGYGYPGHTDKVWYAATQVMIWQTLVNTNDIYFTDSLNGNRVDTYDWMITEINNTIASHETVPSFNNKTIHLVEGEDLELQDTNNVLNNYKTPKFTIKSNKLITKNIEVGTYDIKLTRSDNVYNKPVLFYTSEASQNLVETGNIESKNANVKIVVKKTNLEVTKLDADTKKTTPSGEAQLKGSVIGIYDEENDLVEKLTIDKKGLAKIENLPYGKYYIKEEKAGVGYTINDKKIEFELNENQTEVKLNLENEVIKKKIIINKTYGNKNHQEPEPNIEFNIYDKNNKIIKTIKTNELGKAEYTLPYGEYTIKQLTSTEGYAINSPIKIKVIDNKEQVINLVDYQIEVPNTHTNINIIEMILLLLIF